MNAASHKVFQNLAPGFRHAFALARGTGDDDDLIQDLALAQLLGKSPDFARSAHRRFREGGQGPRAISTLDDERARGIEAEVVDDEDMHEDMQREFGACVNVDKIAEHFGVTKRRGYQIIQKQIRRAQASGDLFAGVVR